ncbi:TIGR03087 family PEP-CTERM/XrtA system glycosyltransferase [Glaciecola petra]|uniref:TIGR03087 family PEP-CTERM/XrtA system glycosyltransferase n=1 Tax=Glaciecola petra TaxID=3075602 RepID=A0ABU2ZQ83_9ALTE|nr:TIGR03087 family PEP-CTERM/XrtA system glycosyltransferase [Aestuariibacter sp. P117]MDT0593617.1 TIGR03087 family PEP-CTERM/XrtA system glycosyltransferase [Aestuariibacter sp. P117]
MANIVVLAHRVPYPPNKGEKLRTFHQIEEIIRKGHSVLVLAPTENDDDVKNAKKLAKHFDITVKTAPLIAKPLRLARALLLRQSFSEANFYSNDLLGLFLLESTNADSVLLTASSLAPYAFALPADQKAQLLMDFMDVDSDKWMQYSVQSSAIKKLVYRREATKVKELEREISERFTRTFVIAETEKKLFQKRVHQTDNILVLGNGIDQSLFNPCESKPIDTINFLFSGVMDYKPNIDAILWFIKNCWSGIEQEIPNARLIIAGMNPTESIKALSKHNNIEVTGFVDDIKPYFDKSHIFVAPFQIARGVQNKVLQAMASAIPVISTALGAEGIMCKDKEDILIAKDAKAFEQLSLTLAKSAKLRSKIGYNGLETINNNYAWESVLLPLTQTLAIGEPLISDDNNHNRLNAK